MTIHKKSNYYSIAVPQAPPLPAVRTRDEDWQALDEVEQVLVDLHLSGLIPTTMPPRSAAFVRRHHPGSVES